MTANRVERDGSTALLDGYGRVVERLLLRKPAPDAAEETDPGTDPVPGGSLP